MTKFKTGDVVMVRQKIKATVEYVGTLQGGKHNGETHVGIMWFDDTGELQRADVPVADVELSK